MTILTVVGARPQFVKAAAVSGAVRARHTEVLVHTGQHYDDEMSDRFFRELGMPAPDHHLEVGSGPHGAQTGRMLERLEAVMVAERPDAVLVYGDTNSTLAGALAAAKLRIPIAHVEAGLRSFNRAMPEEVNRTVTDHLSTWLFCPGPAAVRQLAAEGITRGVHEVGDVMADAFRRFAPMASAAALQARCGVTAGGYYLATVHRAENVDEPERLRAILAALGDLSRPVLFPAHPRVATALRALAFTPPPHVHLLPPVGYLEMLALERDARVILTDSGGVQKEAYWCGVPCVTLRDETEWGETVAHGWNGLAGADRDRIVDLAETASRPAPSRTLFPPGAAAAIADILAEAR